MVSKYFKVVRGGFSDENNLVGFNHTGYAPSIGIDEIVLSDVEYVKKILRIAKESGANVIFMCHSILPDEVDWNDFGWEDFGEASRGCSEFKGGAGWLPVRDRWFRYSDENE